MSRRSLVRRGPEPVPPILDVAGIVPGTRARVHWCIPEGGYSVTGKDPVTGKRRVLGRVPAILLDDVVFHVGPAGAGRIRDGEPREVCAWGTGTIAAVRACPAAAELARLTKITFDPYGPLDEFTVHGTTRPVFRASRVLFAPDPENPVTRQGKPAGYAWI